MSDAKVAHLYNHNWQWFGTGANYTNCNNGRQGIALVLLVTRAWPQDAQGQGLVGQGEERRSDGDATRTELGRVVS